METTRNSFPYVHPAMSVKKDWSGHRLDVCFTLMSGDRQAPMARPKSANAGHRGSNPLAVKACLTAGDVRYAINALAASTCLLAALIPATYKE